ncbi:MAG TPA: ABC transporter permease subunit [Anaeromyxobacteraceae bacterium]|nr:ABC transporter permease subunit [Anaeromyxobacteraceae bacterium]
MITRETWRPARVVLRKELADGLRDRRTLLMALVFPLLGPLTLAVALHFASQTLQKVEREGITLPVAGREHAPNLIAFLGAEARIVPAPADPEAAVRAGDVDAVLVIPPEYGARLREGRPAPVRLVVDESRQQSAGVVAAVKALLAAWGRQAAAQRLVARGIHPSLVEPLAVETVDLATPESRAAIFLSILPYFVVMSMFMGGMAVAIDTTAGERERQSLEPLLVNPVPRSAFVVGKAAAAAAFSALALAETLAGFALLPALLPPERLGFAVRLGPGVLLRVLLVALPLLLLANALMALVAVRARSFRQAQTTISFLMLVPAIPGVLLALSPVKAHGWMLVTPFLAEQVIVSRLVRGEAVEPVAWLAAGGASLVAATLVLLLTVKLFESGRLLFDR